MTQPSWEDMFVGREEELSFLKDTWNKVKDNKPQFVTFTAETGAGKTCLVQQFYHWLNQHEDPNDYWPDTLGKECSSLNINPIFSEKVGQDGIPWLWWGLRSSDPHGRNKQNSAGCALHEGVSNLQPHIEPIILTRKKHELTVSTGSAVASAVANLASFGVFDVAQSIHDLINMHKEEKTRQMEEQRTVAEIAKQKEQDASDIIFDYLQAILKREDNDSVTVPVVLILDDAQWLGVNRDEDGQWYDRSTLMMVERLWQAACKESWPLMIVATHWVREWQQNQQTQLEASPMDEPPRNLSDLLLRNPTLMDSFTQKELRPMQGNQLQIILEAAFPNLTPKQKESIIKRVGGNPQFLDDLIRWIQETPRDFFDKKDTNLPLTPHGEKLINDIGNGDKGHLSLVRRRFAELKDDLRDLLGFGSYQGMEFLEPLIVEVTEHMYGDDEDWQGMMTSAINPFAVIDRVNKATSAFRQRNIFEIAQEHLHKKDSEKFRLSLLSVLKQWYESGRIAEQSTSEQIPLLELFARELEDNPEDKDLFIQVQMALVELYSDSYRSLDAANVALQIVENMPEDGWTLECLSFNQQNRLAFALSNFAHYAKGIKVYRSLINHMQKALANNREDGQFLNDLAAAYMNRGNLYKELNDLEKAESDYGEAISIRRELRNTQGDQYQLEWLNNLATALMNRGSLFKTLKVLDNAVSDYDEAISIRRELRDTQGEQCQLHWLNDLAIALMNRGTLFISDLKDSDKATDDYDEAIRIQRELREMKEDQFPPEWQYDLALMHFNQGSLFRELNESDKAKDDYGEAICILSELLNKQRNQLCFEWQNLVVFSCINWINLYRDIKDSDKVPDDYDKVICTLSKLSEMIGDQFPYKGKKSLAYAYRDRGDLYFDLKDSDKAKYDYSKSIAILSELRKMMDDKLSYDCKKSLASTYINRGILFSEQNKSDKATDDYGKAIDILSELHKMMGDQFPPAWQNSLASAHMSRGTLSFNGQKKSENAAKHFVQAFQLSNELYQRFEDKMPEYWMYVFESSIRTCQALGLFTDESGGSTVSCQSKPSD